MSFDDVTDTIHAVGHIERSLDFKRGELNGKQDVPIALIDFVSTDASSISLQDAKVDGTRISNVDFAQHHYIATRAKRERKHLNAADIELKIMQFGEPVQLFSRHLISRMVV